MTIDPKEAWSLVDIAKEADRQLLVSFGWNYAPIIRSAVNLIAGEIGELKNLSIPMTTSTRELLSGTGAYPKAAADAVPEQSTWTDPTHSGGGYGQAQLSHALGVLLRDVG